MSNWTHIVAVIQVSTSIEDKNIKKRVEETLENAPKITGSEENADIFVNVLSGYNVYTSCDCACCGHGSTVVFHDEGGFSCEAKEDFKCPSGEYQTVVAVTVIGDLRDREKERTEREYKGFYEFLDSRFTIKNESVNIMDF